MTERKSEDVQNSPASSASETRKSFGWLGPGVIMATSGIGASDILTATVGGARYAMELRLKIARTTRVIDLAMRRLPLASADWDAHISDVLESLREAGTL